MDRAKLIETAKRAADGRAYELSAFRELATKAGYTSGTGGWVRRAGGTVCHGWQALAVRVAGGYGDLDVMLIELRITGDTPTTVRMIHTGSVPGTHLVPVTNSLLGRLVCGGMQGGALLPGEVDEARVDCLSCLDGWTELRRRAAGLPPVTNERAGLRG